LRRVCTSRVTVTRKVLKRDATRLCSSRGHNWVLLRLVAHTRYMLRAATSSREVRRRKRRFVSARALRWIRGWVYGRASRLAEEMGEREMRGRVKGLSRYRRCGWVSGYLRPHLPPVPPRVCHHRHRPSVRPSVRPSARSCVLVSTLLDALDTDFWYLPLFAQWMRICVKTDEI